MLEQHLLVQPTTDKSLFNYVRDMSTDISTLCENLNVLTRLAWPVSVKEEFFRVKCNSLPQVSYDHYDATSILRRIATCRKNMLNTEFDTWFSRHLDTIETTANMLANRSRPSFYDNSRALYGTPTQTVRDEKSTPLQLAQSLLDVTQPMMSFNLGAPPKACILSSTLAHRMKRAVKKFGELAPEIVIVDNLSANALAGADRIRIRKNACFTDRDVEQLIEHEINVHVATLLNGKAPENCKLLGVVHPGSTKTQEGLAVFSEIITGHMDIDRLQRLAHRVIAIQMAVDGADFIEVFRYFKEQGVSDDQSFENARRVFRGGVITGGAPFTKDIVYLDGLLRVNNFLRATVQLGKLEYIPLLFVGRLDIEDLKTVKRLQSMGLCQAPKFLPDWVKDLRFLFSYLAYSSFLNTVNMSAVTDYYHKMLIE